MGKFKEGDIVRTEGSDQDWEITGFTDHHLWPVSLRRVSDNAAGATDVNSLTLAPSKTTSDGGSSTYYDLPPGARDLDDLIEHKQMPWAVANIFKACYRFGEKAGTDKSYDVNKILFFAGRMKERLQA